MPSRQDLPSKLAKARQQLQKAQNHVTEFEARLFEGSPNPADVVGSEDRYHRTLDMMLEGCQIIGFDWRYLYINDTAARHGQRTKDELLGYTMMERYPGIEKTPIFAVLQRCMQERRIERIENEFIYPDSTSAWFELNIQPVPEGIFILSLDISERKQAEETLRSSEIRFRSLVEAVEDYAIYLLDKDGYVVSWNAGAERFKGYRSEEIIGQHFSHFFTPEEQQSARPQQFLDIAAVEGRTEHEGWRVCKDGSRFWANVITTALRNADGSLYGFAKVIRDLTQRKYAEENIYKLHRTLGVLSDINQAIVRIRHLPSLFEKACEIAVEKGAFRMAWIGLLEPKSGRINPVAQAGNSDGYIEKLDTGLSNDSQARNPLINSLRTGLRWVCNDLENDPQMLPWHDDAVRLGYRASVALPLKIAGEVRGMFNLYADELDFFDTEELRLMDEMAGDISFAMEVAEQDEQRQQAEAAVKRYAQRMEILHQIDIGIINATSIQEVVNTALKNIREIINCQQLGVALFDFTTNELNFFALDLNAPSMLATGDRYPIPPGYLDEFGANTVRVIDDIQLLPGANPSYTRLIQEGIRASLRAMLMFQEHPIGVLGLNADTPGFFTAEHQEIVAEIANQIAIAIKQLRLSEELARHTAELEQRVIERTADLQVSLVRVEAILNNSPDAILLANADLTIQQANSSFNTLLGSEWDAYFGKSLLTLIHPDDANSASDLLQIAANQPDGKRIEVRAIRKDSTSFEAELSVGGIKGDGLVCTIRDITERKAQERQLHYHAALQESVSDAVFVMDMEFTMQSWNKAAELIYGWTAEEAIGLHANTILRNQLSEEENHRLFAQLIERSWLKFDLIQHHKEGNPLNIWCSMTLIKDIDGHPVGILSVNHDITERKAQERQLRYHASIQESVSDAVIATDMEFKIQSWNHAAETIYGWSAAEAIGKSVNEILHTSYESEADHTRILHDFLEHDAWQGEVIQHHRDGIPINILASVNLFKDDLGQPIGVVSVNRDITERKRVSEALQKSSAEIRDLYNHAPCGYHSIDKNGLVVQINDTELRWLGYTRDEVIGKLKITDIFTSESVAMFRKAFPAFVERGWVNDLEFDVVCKNGSIRHILLNGTAIYDDDGQYLKSRSTLFDITELQQAQQAIIESETLYRLLAENISDVIAKVSPDGIRTYITPSCFALLGYMPDELIGKPSIELAHPDDGPTSRAIVVDAINTSNSDVLVTQRVQHKAGHYLWVEMKVSILRDPTTGSLLEVMMVMRDITERKEKEIRLLEEQQRYRALFEQAHDAVFLLDMRGAHIESNHRAAEMLGYSFEELQTLSFRELSDEAPQSETVLRRLLAGETIPMYERVFRRKDGSRIPVEINIEIVRDLDGNPLHIQSVVRDISERKRAEDTLRESEERYRLLAENIADMIMTFSLDRVITYMSPSCERLLGYLPEEVEGKLHSEFIHPEDYPQVIDRTRQAVASKENFYTNQFRLRHKAGQYIWYEVRTRTIFDHHTGKVVQFISVLRDITERRRADDVLRESEERFRRAIIDAPFPIMIHAEDGEIIQISKRWTDLSGYSPEDIPSVGDWTEKAYGERRESVKSLIDSVYTRNAPLHGGEFRVRTKSSEERIWDFMSAPLGIMPDGRRMVSSMAMDITERKHTEEMLQIKVEEERQFQSHLKTLHDITIELTQIDELDTFYNRTVEFGCDRLGFERLALFLYDEENGHALGTYGTDTQGNITDERSVRFAPDPNAIMMRAFNRSERFYFDDNIPLFNALTPVGTGWNAAAVLWNGTRSLGWLVADNLLSHIPASKSLLDVLGLYALSVGTLLAQKQTQLALRESEALYRLLAENINDLIMRSMLTSECLYISPSVQTILGYTPEELLGRQTFDLVHPDDQATIWEAYASALEQHDLIMPHQYRAKHKEGHYIWLETVGKPLVSEEYNEIYGVITSSRNITDRKYAEEALRESEEKYRSLIETMHDGLAVFDTEFRVTYVNDRFCELLGYSREEAIGKLPVSFVDAAHTPLVQSQLERRQSSESSSYEIPLHHKEGHPVYVLLSGSPLLDKQGKYMGSFAVMTDISVQKEAEETLRQALVKEKELGDLKTRFVSMASHEFRTPLATILALVETLSAYRHRLSEEQIEQRFDKIKDQVGHLKDIMEDVLMLARMQARRVEFNPVKLDLDALARSVLDEFESRADIRHKLEYTVGEGRHELTLDRKLMRQMISNLVSNAIKYSPEGKVIRIILEHTDSTVILKVSDEGIGIPEADLPHVFEPFHRAVNVGSISGTGLGLVITKESVDLHGGTITVESQQDIGTTFIIRIPVSTGEDKK